MGGAPARRPADSVSSPLTTLLIERVLADELADNSRPPSEGPMKAASLAVPLPSAASFANYLTLVDSYRRSLRSENKSPR